MRYVLWVSISLIMVSCGKNSNPVTSSNPPASAPIQGGSSDVYSPAGYNFRFLLKDKVLDEAKNVNVNILKVEILGEGGSGKKARHVLAENIGMVDLLTLRNGVLKALGDVKFPVGAKIQQMRFVLGDGNHLIKNDGSMCALQTPSAQQSGIKILFSEPLSIEDGYSYTLTLDFDVERSIVLKGNGGCLLKPVIKVESAEKKLVVNETVEPVNTGGESDGQFTDSTSINDDTPIVAPSDW